MHKTEQTQELLEDRDHALFIFIPISQGRGWHPAEAQEMLTKEWVTMYVLLWEEPKTEIQMPTLAEIYSSPWTSPYILWALFSPRGNERIG